MRTRAPQQFNDAGRATLALAFSVVLVLTLAVVFDAGNGGQVSSAQATSTATTTVTVLNTPPAWTLTARELYPSATSTPTNSGTSTVWTAIGTDSNGENYYLLICKASSTPTPTAGGAPVCGGGGTNEWAVSAATASGAQAQTSTTTTESFAEKNSWYAYICDGNPGSPRCNATMHNGLDEAGPASATSSPFVVNHRPTFTLAADDSPALPGTVVTWTTTATDTIDVIRGGDQLELLVCKSNDFSAITSSCGAGGTWATSSWTTAGNPSTSTTLAIPLQDTDHDAYVYIVDAFGHTPSGGWQGSSTVLTVANATPVVASSSLAVYDRFGTTTSDTIMSLTTEEGLTDNFVIRFTVSDDNSCQNAASGNEIAGVNVDIYRSGVGGPYGLGCDASGEYNANNCYTDQSPNFVPTCYQVPGSCAGPTQATVDWECTFSMWYVADPTDVGSQYAGEDWRGSARATDDNGATSPYSSDDEAADGASQMTQFLSFRATGSPIAYGSWEPGQDTGVLPATTTVYATGNTGLNENLSGDAMCVTFPACSGNATSTIYVPYQHYATTSSSVAYGSGNLLSTSTSPTLVDVTIAKTTATSSPANDDTYWGIAVPSTITYAGDYIGRNYIDGVVAPSGEW
jgi:hypothetical protein